MARYGPEHKQATQDRIVKSAGLRFRQDGFDGSGIAVVMKDAGLTNGAFYAHFESKDDLVARVVTAQLREQLTAFDDPAAGVAGLESVVGQYLSVEHRDSRREGCPSAALLGEVARGSPGARAAYTEGIVELADTVAAYVDPERPARLRVPVLAVLASLIGTLQLSRALADPELSERLLDEGRRSVLTALERLRDSDPETS